MKKPFIIFFCLIIVLTCKSIMTEKSYKHKELKEDLDYLLKKIENIHPNPYEYTSHEIIEKKRKKIENTITKPITKRECWKRLAQIVSSLNSSHTRLSMGCNDLINTNAIYFPCNTYFANNNNIIYLIPNKISNITGQLLSINGNSVATIITKMQEYIPKYRIKYKFSYYLWLFCNISNEFKVKYISKEDKTAHTATFYGITLDEFYSLIPEKVYGNFDYYTISNKYIGILSVNSFRHKYQKDFDSFLSKTFEKSKNENIKDLVIDIRNNGGGSDYNGRLLFNYITDNPYMQLKRTERKVSKEYKETYKKYLNIKWYNILFRSDYIKLLFEKEGSIIYENNDSVKPDNNEFLFKGKVYLLTSSRTSSAAMDFAAAFKYYKMGTIIGEETGGSLMEYSNGIPFTLPNTKLEGIIASQKAICVGAKDDGHGVIPDYEVIPSMDDVYNGTDRVMEFTKELIEKRRKSNNN